MENETSAWQPIATCPHGARVLLAVAGSTVDYVHLATWLNYADGGPNDQPHSQPYVPNDWTHWMPAPTPPAEAPLLPASPSPVEPAGVDIDHLRRALQHQQQSAERAAIMGRTMAEGSDPFMLGKAAGIAQALASLDWKPTPVLTDASPVETLAIGPEVGTLPVEGSPDATVS